MKNNNVILYQGLFLFRNTVLSFIIEKLQEAYGKGYWDAGVKPALGESTLAALERQFERRYKTTLASVKRPGSKVYQMLDVGHFLPIIQKNWKRCFTSIFEEQNRDKVEVWFKEIIEVRNAVAHPEDQPLSDEDTWRSLDTMIRLLSSIDPNVAEQISQLRDGERIVDEKTTQSRPLLFGWKEGPHDYELGLIQLESAILKEEERGSEIHLKFIRHRDQLARALWETRLTPGVQNPDLATRIERILEELDRLTIHYSVGDSFRDLCVVPVAPPQPVAPKDSLMQIRELEIEIGNVEHELYKKEYKKAAQKQIGETIPQLERQIVELQTNLEAKRKELTHLMETATPPAYFSIHRKLSPNGDNTFVEEQYISVSVEIVNEGQDATDITYEEQLPESFEIVEGDLRLQTHVEPGSKAVLSYRCYPTCAGKYQLSTKQFEYQGRSSEWDRIENTALEVRPGVEPILTAARYYHFQEQGLRLIINLKNNGDKIARKVRYAEAIDLPEQENAVQIAWEGNIPGGGAEQTIEQSLAVSETENISLSDSVKIKYEFRDNNKNEEREIVVDPGFKRIEYCFPVATDVEITTVGRETELQMLSSLVEQVWQLARGTTSITTKRLLLIKGIEGTGKTRLVYELVNLAQHHGFAWHVEDAKDRSPVKRMLKRLLGLKPDENRDELIWKELEKVLPGEEHSLRRDMIFRFIFTVHTSFTEEELDLLQAYVVVLVKTLCRSTPTLLVFENIHLALSGGVEEQLLLNLFNSVLISSGEPILFCATFRPGETGDPFVVSQLPLSRSNYERLELGPIARMDIRTLVDRIIDFPHFSSPLYEFIEAWSGNPLYLIELLRLLTHPDSHYLIRNGSQWYPAPNIKLEEVIPDNIPDIILERVKNELSDEAKRLVRVLSVVGFELPSGLIEALSAYEFEWSTNQLYHHLDMLVQAGLLTWTADEGYQFEHQLKRDVLKESLPEREQLRLRQYIAQILLDNDNVFADPTEQLRQLARHLVKSPKEFQRQHLSEIKRVAELERDERNFDRSLELYKAVLDLTSRESFERAHLFIERSRLYQMKGNWVAAERDLENAYRLIAPESALSKTDGKLAANLRTQIKKERGRIMLKQPQASLQTANELLFKARKGIEGNLPYIISRLFLPDDRNIYQNLIEIYLALAEIWLRQHDFKTCEKACKRAEWLAQKAFKKWPDRPFLHEVYLSLGNLYFERGGKENYRNAQYWYEAALDYVRNDRYQQARIRSRLADTYSVLGDIVQAQDAYEQAIQIQEQLGDAYGLALSYGGLGNLSVEQGQLDEGRSYCEQAYNYQQLVSDLNRFWRTCVSLTKIHLKQGNPGRAAEYWLQARTVLFDQKYVDDLKGRKREEIIQLTRRFCAYFRKSQQWEELSLCTDDRDYLMQYSMDRDEQVQIQTDLGVAALKLGRWHEAIEAFKYVLEKAEQPNQQADACEWLGDIYATYEPSATLPIFGVAQFDEAQEQAERYYEEAIKRRIRIGDSRQALTTYEKLLNRMVADEAGLMQLPFTFFSIFREISSQQLLDQIVGKTLDVLLENRLFVEAGDILVYTARILAKTDEHKQKIPLESKLTYLRRAEEIYRQGTEEDVIWGLNMLIPSFFRFNLWNEVTRCFEALFELNIKVGDANEFIEAYSAIGTLRDHVKLEEIEYFTSLVISGQRQLYLSVEQQMRLRLHIAKHYSYMADKTDDSEREKQYQDLALEYFERILTSAVEETSLLATALNDSALIYVTRKEYEEAMHKYSRAIRIDERLGNYEGSSHIRVNRASLYRKMNEPDKAYADYERAITFLQRKVEYWDQRLAVQDQQPLSPREITALVYDKKWLASTYRDFATLLLSRGQVQQAQELRQQAARRYQEIGMEESAQNTLIMVLPLEQFLSGLQFDSSSTADLFGKTLRLCPSCEGLITEGVAECPTCGQLICPKCGATVDEEDEICPSCGAVQPLFCINCGKEVGIDDLICPHCKEQLEE